VLGGILNLLVDNNLAYTDKRVKKKRRWGKVFEYQSYERSLPVGKDYEEKLSQIEEDFTKRKNFVVTAPDIAARLDIRVSVAQNLLDDLEEKNIIKKSISSRRLKVYVKA
jgi:ribosomal protein S25